EGESGYAAPFGVFPIRSIPFLLLSKGGNLLSPFEIWLSFLDKCTHPFAHILCAEEQEEVFALNLQPFFQRSFKRSLHCILCQAYSQRGLSRNRLCQLDGLRQMFPFRDDVVN